MSLLASAGSKTNITRHFSVNLNIDRNDARLEIITDSYVCHPDFTHFFFVLADCGYHIISPLFHSSSGFPLIFV